MPASGLPAAVRVAADAVRVDAGGGIVLPGFVDCHTHLVFAGWRAGEFAQRIGGASYQEILKAGEQGAMAGLVVCPVFLLCTRLRGVILVPGARLTPPTGCIATCWTRSA